MQSEKDFEDVRRRLGFTQVQMAGVLGISVRTYTRLENGQARPTKIQTLAIHMVALIKEGKHDPVC